MKKKTIFVQIKAQNNRLNHGHAQIEVMKALKNIVRV